MRNPGYVHELAAIHLAAAGALIADRDGVAREDLMAAAAALAPLSEWQRREKIRALYVADALEKGYAVGDPAGEATLVLRERALRYYNSDAGS